MKVVNHIGSQPGEFTWKLRIYNASEINEEERERVTGSMEDEDERDKERSDASKAGELGEDDPDNQSSEESDRSLKVADFLVYGDIGDNPWDATSVAPKAFLDAIAAAGVLDKVNVRIHSLGGNVLDALAIYNGLEALDAEVNTYIDGMAASSASIIALAGDHAVARKNTFLMIHNPFAFAMGDAEEMRKQADVLDDIRKEIVEVYQNKTKLPIDRIRKMMDDETWMNAKKAKRLGFIDEIRGRSKVNIEKPKNKVVFNGVVYNVAKFKNVPVISASADDESVIISKDTKTDMADSKDAPKKLTLDDLKSQCPDLYNQIVAESSKSGIDSERSRLSDLEELSTPATASLVAKAKADGRKASDIMKECFALQKNFKPTAGASDAASTAANRMADAGAVNAIGGDSPADKTKMTEMRSSLVDSIVRHGTSYFNSKHPTSR